MASMNLAQRIAAAPRDQLAAVDEVRSITYGQLLDSATQLARHIGIEKELVILSCDNSIDWLIAYTAVVVGGHAVFLVAPEATAYQATLAATFQATVALSAATGYQPQRLAHTRPAMDPSLSVLLSTSGSTGSPKSVRLSAENLASNAQSIATYLALDDSERGVVSLPVHYSYGLSIVNSHLWVGAALLMTSRSLIEPEFWAFCNQHASTSFGGVPHSYDLLSRIDFAASAPPSLRYFTQAGGRLSQEHISGFLHLAQTHGWRFYVMYGQTEAAPRMAWLPPADALRHVGSIGIAIPGGELSVCDPDGEPLAPEAEGELVYTGHNVMMGYASTAADLALGQGPRELRTGDLARQSADGFFYITGRMSRFVKIFGNRIGLDETEKICAKLGFPAIATGTDHTLLVVTRQLGAEAELKKQLAAQLKLPEMVIEVRHMSEYPLLTSGKIDYASLKATLTAPAATVSPPHGTTQASVKAVYRAIFGAAADDGALSFMDLGGDSLTFVRASLDLESAFGALPENWHQMPADTLNAALQKQPVAGPSAAPSRTALLGNLDTVRAIACILVVAFHVLGDDSTVGLQIPDHSSYRLPFELLDLLRMPLFTALAGLLYASMAHMNDSLLGFVKRRFVTLMVPAMVLSVVYYGMRLAMGKTEPPLDLFGFGYLHFWYLYALFDIAVVMALLDTAMRPTAKGWLAIALGAFAISVAMPPSAFSAAFELAPYYVLGIVIAGHPLALRANTVVYGALAVSVVGLAAQALNFYLPQPGLMPLLGPLASVALVVVALRFMPRIPRIEWIGIYSYTIYLWHPAVNSVLRTVLTKVVGNQLSVLFVVGTLVATCVPILIHRVASRWPAVIRIPLTGT